MSENTPPPRPAWVKASIEREDRRRMRQNFFASLVILVLLVAGYFLVETFVASSRLVACLEAGHRHCSRVPIDRNQVPSLPAR